tara:strand:- start:235 stop:630 length:396 start_codon:yes stop_codon:yes gene_type:complete
MGHRKLEGRSGLFLGDREKANSLVVFRIAVSDGYLDTLISKLIQSRLDQFLSNTLVLMIGIYRHGGKKKHHLTIVLVGQARKDSCADYAIAVISVKSAKIARGRIAKKIADKIAYNATFFNAIGLRKGRGK